MIKVKHKVTGKVCSAEIICDDQGRPSLYNVEYSGCSHSVGYWHQSPAYNYTVIDEPPKPTPHRLADVIHAFADGYEVQSKEPVTGKWEDAKTPVFGECEYRIKPVINEVLQQAEEELLAINVTRIELENTIKRMKEDL